MSVGVSCRFNRAQPVTEAQPEIEQGETQAERGARLMA